MVAREVQLLQKLSRQEYNQFTVKMLDAFVNSEAEEDMSKLTTVFVVMEYFEFDM